MRSSVKNKIDFTSTMIILWIVWSNNEKVSVFCRWKGEWKGIEHETFGLCWLLFPVYILYEKSGHKIDFIDFSHWWLFPFNLVVRHTKPLVISILEMNSFFFHKIFHWIELSGTLIARIWYTILDCNSSKLKYQYQASWIMK